MSRNVMYGVLCRTCGFCLPPGTEHHTCPLEAIKITNNGSQQLGTAILEGLRCLIRAEVHHEQQQRSISSSGSSDPNLNEDGRLGAICLVDPSM